MLINEVDKPWDCFRDYSEIFVDTFVFKAHPDRKDKSVCVQRVESQMGRHKGLTVSRQTIGIKVCIGHDQALSTQVSR